MQVIAITTRLRPKQRHKQACLHTHTFIIELATERVHAL